MTDPKDVQAMADILRAMQNVDLDAVDSTDNMIMESSEQGIAPPSRLSDPSVDAMKNILSKLYAVSDEPVHRLAEAAQTDHELREALQTEATPRGARIGSWEIVAHDTNPKTFDVINIATNEPIASSLYLYEAAYGLVKHLNQGITINDKRVRDLLKLEENYARARDDAARYKLQEKSLRKKGDGVRAAIAEDRCDEAQRQAQVAQDEIERMTLLAGIRR